MWGRRRTQPPAEPQKELPSAQKDTKPAGAKPQTAPQKTVRPPAVPASSTAKTPPKTSGELKMKAVEIDEKVADDAPTTIQRGSSAAKTVAPKPSPAPAAPKGTSTVVGDGMEIKGDVTTASDLEVRGAIEGDVNSSGHVEIFADGLVKGTVTAQSVNVAGTVEGDVSTRGRLFIRSSGVVKGDVRVKSLNVDEGGTLTGRCMMTG